MNIRTKMIALLALLFAVLIVLEIAVQKQVLMPSFAQLEREEAETSMKRIGYALDSTLESMELTAADWGNWSDVYQFVQSPNLEFVRANVTATAMKQLKVNAMLIVDLNGSYVLSSARSLDTGEPLDLDLAARKALPEDFPWRRSLVRGKSARGLLRTNRGVMMMAAAPVLDGSGGGPPFQTGSGLEHPSRQLPLNSVTNEVKIEKRGNTYRVPVRINQTITLPFLLDTGATDLVIPADVALTLIRAGALTSNDFIGKSRYSLANGSEEVSHRVIIREVQVGEHAVRNVTASISPPQGEPLLGQSFLSKFGAVTLDYKRLVLILSH